MKIINLVENEIGSSGCEASHGLSFYIETEKHKILFDTGPSDILLRNAEKLNIDLSEIDTVILSHGHYDHSGGILPFSKINPNAKIYMQKSAVEEHFAFDGEEKGFRYIGIDKKILDLPNVIFLNGDTKLDEELSLFVVDKRVFPLPSTNKRIRVFDGKDYSQDNFLHEQNLLLTSENLTSERRRILICGCSHSGILNIMETLKRKFPNEDLPELVLGGFHLMKMTEYSMADSNEICQIANSLKNYKSHFATCHCTGLQVFEQMKEIMGSQISYVHSGDAVILA